MSSVRRFRFRKRLISLSFSSFSGEQGSGGGSVGRREASRKEFCTEGRNEQSMVAARSVSSSPPNVAGLDVRGCRRGHSSRGDNLLTLFPIQDLRCRGSSGRAVWSALRKVHISLRCCNSLIRCGGSSIRAVWSANFQDSVTLLRTANSRIQCNTVIPCS